MRRRLLWKAQLAKSLGQHLEQGSRLMPLSADAKDMLGDHEILEALEEPLKIALTRHHVDHQELEAEGGVGLANLIWETISGYAKLEPWQGRLVRVVQVLRLEVLARGQKTAKCTEAPLLVLAELDPPHAAAPEEVKEEHVARRETLKGVKARASVASPGGRRTLTGSGSLAQVAAAKKAAAARQAGKRASSAPYARRSPVLLRPIERRLRIDEPREPLVGNLLGSLLGLGLDWQKENLDIKFEAKSEKFLRENVEGYSTLPTLLEVFTATAQVLEETGTGEEGRRLVALFGLV